VIQMLVFSCVLFLNLARMPASAKEHDDPAADADGSEHPVCWGVFECEWLGLDAGGHQFPTVAGNDSS